jgi:hypothetical protein
MLAIIKKLADEYDPKIGYKKSNISINKFPINLNDIKTEEPQNLLYGYSRVYDMNLFNQCIYTYFKKKYSKIKIIDHAFECLTETYSTIEIIDGKFTNEKEPPSKDITYDLIIDLVTPNKSIIDKYKYKNYIRVYNPDEEYSGGTAELLFFPFGKLMGYPIIHVTDSHLKNLLKFGDITSVVNTYNLIYRESEPPENAHCFDCYCAKNLGVIDVKHEEGTLNNYINSLVIYPLMFMNSSINEIDFDLDKELTAYFDPPITTSQFESTTKFTPDAAFVPVTSLGKYKNITFKYKLPYTFTIVDLTAEMKLMNAYFKPTYYINDLSHSDKDPVTTILASQKSQYCVKIRPTGDFKFSSKANIFLAPYSCNIDCNDINLTGNTDDLKTLDITIKLQDIINFKMYYNFVERNLRHWFIEDETQTCCYDCIFAQTIDPSFKTKKIGIHHNIMKNYLPIQRLKILLWLHNTV